MIIVLILIRNSNLGRELIYALGFAKALTIVVIFSPGLMAGKAQPISSGAPPYVAGMPD
jgi:hypothetical protein